MYKGNSASLQRAHGVHRVAAAPAPGDCLTDVEQMDLREALAEKARLQAEIARVENELIAAKRRGLHEAAALGQRKSSIQGRLSAVNARIKALNHSIGENLWRKAVSELCPEKFEAVIARVVELGKVARGQK